MFNSSANGKDNVSDNGTKRSTVPPLFGLEAISDLRIDRNRTPNVPYNNQNRNTDDDLFSVPRFIYSPTPIDKPSNQYNVSSSPSMISPSVFNSNRYNYSPSYNPSPLSLIAMTDTTSKNQNQSQQNQSQPLSMSSLLDTTNTLELPKSEPLFNVPPLSVNSMPPPSSTPPSTSLPSASPPLSHISLPSPPPVPSSSNITLPSQSPTSSLLSVTPKFEDLPPLSGDIFSSSLFSKNNNNNNNSDIIINNNNISGLSGLLSKATLEDNFNLNFNSNQNNNNGGDILLYRNNSPIFDINRIMSNSISSSSSSTSNTISTSNNNNNNNTHFSNISLARQPTSILTASLSSSSSNNSLFKFNSSSNNNNGGNNSNDSFVPSETDISNYDELMKELVMCKMCAQRLQKVKCFSYSGEYICCSCSGKIVNRKTLGDWEIEEQNGVLCKRLNHRKNRVSYMKKQANGSFKIETLCIFCRNMKSYEYYRKQESKSLKI